MSPLVLCFVLLIQLTFGKIERGNLNSDENWVFLTRFCFLGSSNWGRGHVGRLRWNISYEQVYHKVNNSAATPHSLLLYSDDVWDKVYPALDMSCAEKKAVAMNSSDTSSHEVSPIRPTSGCTPWVSDTGVPMYTCSAGIMFGTPREKWWYIVLENCQSKKGIKVSYEMIMTNADDENIFFHHYSADEFYILETDIGFLVVYCIMALLSFYVTRALMRLLLFHTTYKLYLVSLFLQLIALIIQVAFWSNYGLTGIPKDFEKYVGRFLEFASTITFVVLVILMAKGYTITRGRIRKIGVIKIIILSLVYCTVTIAMLIWEATSFDPGEVLYIYDSLPGYCLIAVRILAWLWFCYATFFTLKNYWEKQTFYLPFFIIYCIWFWAAPIVTFVAYSWIPKWSKEKVVNGVNLLVIFLGHLIFMILTWPSQANANFPYYVKTSQITDASIVSDPSRAEAYEASATVEPVMTNGNIFTTQTNGTTRTVNIDRFPHETGDYIQERAIAMNNLTQ